MKVSELIEELESYNPNAEITTPYSGTIELSYISEQGENKSTTKIVFIEWADYMDREDVDDRCGD